VIPHHTGKLFRSDRELEVNVRSFLPDIGFALPPVLFELNVINDYATFLISHTLIDLCMREAGEKSAHNLGWDSIRRNRLFLRVAEGDGNDKKTDQKNSSGHVGLPFFLNLERQGIADRAFGRLLTWAKLRQRPRCQAKRHAGPAREASQDRIPF